MNIRFSMRVALLAAIGVVLPLTAVSLTNAAPPSMDFDPWVKDLATKLHNHSWNAETDEFWSRK